jgi:hypothetical protein
MGCGWSSAITQYQNTGEHVVLRCHVARIVSLEGAEQHRADEHEHRTHGDDVPLQGQGHGRPPLLVQVNASTKVECVEAASVPVTSIFALRVMRLRHAAPNRLIARAEQTAWAHYCGARAAAKPANINRMTAE